MSKDIPSQSLPNGRDCLLLPQLLDYCAETSDPSTVATLRKHGAKD